MARVVVLKGADRLDFLKGIIMSCGLVSLLFIWIS